MEKSKAVIKVITTVMILSGSLYAGAMGNPDKGAAVTGDQVNPYEVTKAMSEDRQESKADKGKEAEVVKENESKAEAIRTEEKTAAVKSAGKASSQRNRVKAETTEPKSTDSGTKSIGGKEQAKQSETTQKPVHVHKWNPVYSERQVQKTKQIPWTKCYKCGADMTGDPSHIDRHLLNHETDVHYGTEYRTEVYYETETYLSGYRCSCGASK